MGYNWFKNRPKTPIKPRTSTQTAVNLDEPASASLPLSARGGKKTSSSTSILGNASDSQEIASNTVVASDTDIASGAEVASASSNASDTALASSSLSIKDPVLYAWEHLRRSPFEESPFTRILEDVGKKASATAAITRRKPTQLLPGPFAGLIETEQDLSAIIGGKAFKTGQIYDSKKIKKVDFKIITLEDDAAIYLMPKKGVTLSIASDGTSAILGDTYEKK